MRLRRHKSKKGRIEIIPMIDVVFFLLVFSMLSALTMAEMNKLQADVPKAGSTGGGAVNRITVNDIKGKLFLTYETPYREGQLNIASITEIQPLIAKEFKRNPQVAVLINVEDSVSFGQGAAIVDQVKGSGAPLVIPAS